MTEAHTDLRPDEDLPAALNGVRRRRDVRVDRVIAARHGDYARLAFNPDGQTVSFHTDVIWL